MIYGVFDIIEYMFSNQFSCRYRVFLVLSESFQVWSCTGWEMDYLERKRLERMKFGDFHAEQPEDCS